MKKLIALLCIVSAIMLAGCAATTATPTNSPTASVQAAPEAVTLFDTSTVKIVLEGTETTVTDKTSGSTYQYKTTRTLTTTQPTLEQMQARCIARTSASTDSMEIQIAGGLIIVHDLAGGQVYYIDR